MDGLKGSGCSCPSFFPYRPFLALPTGLYGHVRGRWWFSLRPGDRLLTFGWFDPPSRYLVANILAGECQPSGWQRAGNEALIKIRERSEPIIVQVQQSSRARTGYKGL